MASRRRRQRRERKARRAAEGGSSFLASFLRRRSTRWLAAAIATMALAIVLGLLSQGGDEDGEGGATPTPTIEVSVPDLQPDSALLQQAAVVRVIDGDTIVVRLDGGEERVRYFGVDTPERRDRCFDEATERNEALVGEEVLLLPDLRERDQFDRLLRYVFTPGGESIDARLVAEGLGEAWRQDGAYRDQLLALEGDAQAGGVGCLWAAGG